MEILLVYVLSLFHVDLASAAAAVVTYRLFNFWLAFLPAAAAVPYSRRVEQALVTAKRLVASLLDDHVVFRVSSVDRDFVSGYIRDLVHEGGLVRFLLHRAALVGDRGIPSPSLLGHNRDRLAGDLDRFVAERELPVVRFRRGESKE